MKLCTPLHTSYVLERGLGMKAFNSLQGTTNWSVDTGFLLVLINSFTTEKEMTKFSSANF